MAALFLCPPFLSYCSVLRGIPSFLLCLGYSQDIRGVFVGYSWGIHMYRVCVGYVSGMYRESIEGDGERGGLWMKQKKEYRHPCSQARRNLNYPY